MKCRIFLGGGLSILISSKNTSKREIDFSLQIKRMIIIIINNKFLTTAMASIVQVTFYPKNRHPSAESEKYKSCRRCAQKSLPRGKRGLFSPIEKVSSSSSFVTFFFFFFFWKGNFFVTASMDQSAPLLRLSEVCLEAIDTDDALWRRHRHLNPQNCTSFFLSFITKKISEKNHNFRFCGFLVFWYGNWFPSYFLLQLHRYATIALLLPKRGQRPFGFKQNNTPFVTMFYFFSFSCPLKIKRKWNSIIDASYIFFSNWFPHSTLQELQLLFFLFLLLLLLLQSISASMTGASIFLSLQNIFSLFFSLPQPQMQKCVQRP